MAIKYENAPITEALIDIQVEVPPGTKLDLIEGARAQILDRYPSKSPIFQFEGQFSTGERVFSAASRQGLGIRFMTADGKQIFQARLNGCTFSRLRPYGTWDDLRDESRRLWGIYKNAVSPSKISRVGVRYINKIDIPASQIELRDYFLTSPDVAKTLSQNMQGFFMQLQFPRPEFNGLLVLTQTTTGTASLGITSVIFDIDVFKASDRLAPSLPDEEIWSLLEKMRETKNEFFEGSITQKTRDLFGQRISY